MLDLVLQIKTIEQGAGGNWKMKACDLLLRSIHDMPLSEESRETESLM
jgi:hypothetical protein